MSVFTLVIDNKDKIRAKAGINENTLMEAVKMLREWLEIQPHLPHDYDDARLETLYFRCKSSIEKCKQTIDMYYTVKSAVPEIFFNRDPAEPWFKQVTSYGCVTPLPEMTEDYERIIMISYLNQDSSKRSVYDMFKYAFMGLEIRTVEDYSLSDIYVFDLENFTAGDVVKYTPPVVKKIEVILFQAFKGRMKAVLFINTAPYVDTIVDIFRRLLKPKLAARVHAYRKGSFSLSDMFSPKILPKEYGGEAGSMLDHRDKWVKKVESYRDWFVEKENKKVDESKRPDKTFNASELFGFEGSFRQLNVD